MTVYEQSIASIMNFAFSSIQFQLQLIFMLNPEPPGLVCKIVNLRKEKS